MPTLPTSFYDICRVADDPQSSAREIARVVMRDQVLTAKVLRMINSAFYGIPRKIAKIEQSIALLGMNAIKNIILASSIFKALGRTKKIEGLWVHTLAVAIGAKVIAKRMDSRELEEIFICGLLHDIGKVVEFKLYPAEIEKVRQQCLDKGKYYREMEKELFDIGHERIGQMLLNKWKMPEKYKKAVGFHHHPHPKRDFALETTIVFLADALAKSLSLGDSWDNNLVPKIKKEQLHLAGMETLSNEDIVQSVTLETEELSQIFLERN